MYTVMIRKYALTKWSVGAVFQTAADAFEGQNRARARGCQVKIVRPGQFIPVQDTAADTINLTQYVGQDVFPEIAPHA